MFTSYQRDRQDEHCMFPRKREIIVYLMNVLLTGYILCTDTLAFAW